MIRLAADENLHHDIVRGLRRRVPDVDIVRMQDTEMAGAEDPALLAWVASEQRILLTHDVRTMIDFAYDRVGRGESMPGVFIVGRRVAVARAIDDLVLLLRCSADDEWEGQVLHLPL